MYLPRTQYKWRPEKMSLTPKEVDELLLQRIDELEARITEVGV